MKNDRLDPELLEGTNLPKPEVEIVVSGKRIVKPSMKTFFVKLGEDGAAGEIRTGNTVYSSICTCDLVCTCETVCSCDSHSACTCVSVCGCNYYNECGCQDVGHFRDGSICSTNCYVPIHMDGQPCTCNGVCPCAPVH